MSNNAIDVIICSNCHLVALKESYANLSIMAGMLQYKLSSKYIIFTLYTVGFGFVLFILFFFFNESIIYADIKHFTSFVLDSVTHFIQFVQRIVKQDL